MEVAILIFIISNLYLKLPKGKMFNLKTTLLLVMQ